MTSLIAAGGSGRSASFIPANPAAWSVTTIAFIFHLPRLWSRPVPRHGPGRPKANVGTVPTRWKPRRAVEDEAGHFTIDQSSRKMSRTLLGGGAYGARIPTGSVAEPLYRSLRSVC